MSLYSQYETNAEKEANGVDIEMHEAVNKDGSVPTFILCRMGKSNVRYSKALEAATRPYRRQIELNTMDNAKAETIFRKVFVDTVLVGWRNVPDKEGNIIEFNKQNALKLLVDLPDLYERLQDEAKEAANFRDLMLEEEAKN